MSGGLGELAHRCQSIEIGVIQLLFEPLQVTGEAPLRQRCAELGERAHGRSAAGPLGHGPAKSARLPR